MFPKPKPALSSVFCNELYSGLLERIFYLHQRIEPNLQFSFHRLVTNFPLKATHILDRRHFIGGSDARIIMGKDEKALLRLWQEKRGEAAALDLRMF